MTTTQPRRQRAKNSSWPSIAQYMDFGFWDSTQQIFQHYSRNVVGDYNGTVTVYPTKKWRVTGSNTTALTCDTCTPTMEDYVSIASTWAACTYDDDLYEPWAIVDNQSGVVYPPPKDALADFPHLIIPRPELTAKERARELLLTHLSSEQKEEFLLEGYFHVKGPSGRVYRITQGHSLNVLAWGPQGEELGKYCLVHRQVQTPVEDQMLTQKIMLELDEAEFLKIANHFPPTKKTQLVALSDYQRGQRRQAV